MTSSPESPVLSTRRALRNPPGGAHTWLLHNQLIGERLYLYCLARFLVVLGVGAGTLFAKYVVGVDELNLGRLLAVAGSLAAYNSIVFVMVRPYRHRDRAASSYSILAGIMHGTIMLDFLFLTVTLWLVGGAKSPFQAFYLFHVILASVLLSRTATFLHALLGYVFLAALVLGEWFGWIPPCYPQGAVNADGPLDGRYVLTLLVVYGMLFVLAALMLTSLMQLLRAGEREIRAANAKLENLSELRRDFLHVALHNLKTPVSAASMQLHSLKEYLADGISEQGERCLQRCQQRLKEQVEFLNDLQILAFLEADGIEREAKDIDMRDVLEALEREYEDVARTRAQSFKLELPDGPLVLHGIERLLREAVANLVTNALKYTPKGGAVMLRAEQREGAVRIEVQDTGIGIAAADQKRLFQEFAKIRSDDTRVDQKGSTGLGLSIVRRIAEIHGGTVGLTSHLGQGSTFYIEFPIDVQ